MEDTLVNKLDLEKILKDLVSNGDKKYRANGFKDIVPDNHEP